MFSVDSRIKDIYKSPVGHDIIKKLLLQTGTGDWVISVIGGLKLKTLEPMARKFAGDTFLETILALLNSEKSEALKPLDEEVERKWWKEAVFYQIYPRSFKDSDGDGVGDIGGIISKLDYLKDLGVDALWLCPIYDSPNADNGYDIRDYKKISEEYGGMEAFESLLEEVHKRGMKLIMDLVVNHTSDEHEWFQEALKPDSEFRDFYFFRKGEGESPPNNWTSFFSGPAWKKQDGDWWSMHLFAEKQMDLNWDHEPLRGKIHEMIRWWLEKGVDGFRLDVINYISKPADLPPGNPMVGKLMGYTGVEHYFYGPRLHEHLSEMKKKAFEPLDAFSVGETPGIGLEMTKLLTSERRKELDMAFCFDILETPGKARFDEYVYNPVYIKKYYKQWMKGLGSDCWMALFFNNHDNPRMVSKIDPEGLHRKEVAKLLAMIQMTVRGTPFIYQGDELGAGNHPFKSIKELRDVESLNLHNELLKTMAPGEAFRKVLAGTRDHARVAMQWDESGGFSEGTPWIIGGDPVLNAKTQQADESSIFWFYKKLAKLRRENKDLVYGKFELQPSRDPIFSYIRRGQKKRFLIVCNMGAKEVKRPDLNGWKPLLLSTKLKPSYLGPYEACMFWREN
jgi:oligo-1,6-glucosidase